MATSINPTITPQPESDASCVGRGLTEPQSISEHNQTSDFDVASNFKQHLFSRFNILRSSAFRLGMTFWLLFTLCFGLGLFGFYTTLQERMFNRIDSSIVERLENVQRVYEQDGLEAVIEMAESKSDSPMKSSMGFHLSTTQGDRIAGNVPICITQPGWDVLGGEDLGLEADDSTYRFLTSDVGGNVISLGKSMDDLVELRRIAMMCSLWMLALSTALALAVAFVFTQRTQRRVNEISGALNKVAAGNLRARLPITSADDDIDILSSKINASLDRLSLTVESMRQVSTDIAHDLKTPLNRLYITMEEASVKSRQGECVADDLEGALDEAQAINGTFEALLRIAQIEAGAKKSQFKSLDIKEVLETAAEVYAPVVEENEQQLIIDLAPELRNEDLSLMGDKNLMMQLVVNLIENSVNHCKAGTVITLSGGRDEQGLWMQVADSGPGIPENEREKVFQRLYRLERSRTTRGTGLGLSLVKAIADLHCGAIELGDNNPGLKTTIRFIKNCPKD